MGLRTAIIPFTVSGTGISIGSQVMFPSGLFNGRLRRIVARQEVGGGATAVTIYGVHRKHAGTDPAAIPQEYVPFQTASIAPPTASATTAFLDSPVDAEPTFQDSFKLFFKVTTGAGAWTFTGYVEIEM